MKETECPILLILFILSPVSCLEGIRLWPALQLVWNCQAVENARIAGRGASVSGVR